MLPLDLFASHQVTCGDGQVILDLQSDSYGCRYEEGEPTPSPNVEPLMPAWRDALPLDDRIAWRDVARFAQAWRRALLSFHGRPLRSLMITVLELARVTPAADAPSALVLAARFERMCVYLPFRPACLLRAYVLLHYLAGHGRTADWVIAVRLFPFQAHCWIAEGHMLLAEKSHLIEDYVPIYRLRQGR